MIFIIERVYIPGFSLPQEPKYKFNQSIVSVLGYGDNKKIKITTMNVLRTAGIECEDERIFSERGSVNDEKLAESLSRTKRTIFELAFCNPWKYFFTATLDKTKYNRTDLEKFHKDITQWFRDQNKKHGCKIKFLLIPELHSDGQSWHMHGFLDDVPECDLVRFKLGDKMGKAIAEKVSKGEEVYHWLGYTKKFGFNDLEPIKNHEAVSKYVTKYISKELANSVTELNAHQYYCSRGLKRAETIKKGSMSANIKPDYVGDYCSVAWLPYSEKKLDEILRSFD